jgi:DNA-binding response OmpR family regulator
LIQRVVLVVDDERRMVDLIADVLESEGFAVKCACDGLEALHEIKQKRPDLVITDILMPGLDGISLARKILGEKHPIPIILMSASRRQLTEFNAPFIAKPFEIDDLVALARKHVEDSQELAVTH